MSQQTGEGAPTGVPTDWPLSPLGELFHFANGVNADKSAYGRGVPFINVLEVITRSHLSAEDVPGRVALAESTFQSFAVRRGDVVFNRTSETLSEVGLAAVYQDDAPVVFGGFVIRGQPIGDDLDESYLGYALRAPIIRSQIISQGQGAIRANIGQSNLRRVLIPIPPKAEQQAIAEALSDTDELVAALGALLAKKQALKRATMQQLLTGQTRLPGFSDDWTTKRLADLGHFLKGSGVRRDDALSGDLACVRYGEIYTTHHDYIRRFHSWISPEVASTATPLTYGDLLFAGSGETKEEIGKCVAFVTDTEAYAGGDIVILRPRNVDSLFLGYALNIPPVAIQKASFGQGDAVVHISAGALAKIKVRLPSIAEQAAIASVLTDFDAEIGALRSRRDKVLAVKHGMMQKLLTGHVRLNQEVAT